ncbi:MAG: hypothetical protein AAFX93_14510 [Verrucomicrobiota bacterium]
MFITTGSLLLTSATHAVLTINVTESGSNVVFSGSGDLDLTGASFIETAPSGSFNEVVVPSNGVFANQPSFPTIFDTYSLTSPHVSYGPGAFFSSSTGNATGTPFIVTSGSQRVLLPTGYTTGDPIAFTTTFVGQSFASLGISIASYSWTVPSDIINLNISLGAPVVAIPEPAVWVSSWGFALLTGMTWYRRLSNRSTTSNPSKNSSVEL